MRWRKIPEFENYEISESGIIRSIERYYFTGEYYTPRFMPSQIMQPKIGVDGYFNIGLRRTGKRHFKRRCRLVAITFIPNPYKKPFVNHKDGDKLNDNMDNLEWSTESENMLHSYRVLGRKLSGSVLTPKYGKDNPAARSVNKLSMNGEILATYDCLTHAEPEGFIKSKICLVAQGKRKTHGGFGWAYV